MPRVARERSGALKEAVLRVRRDRSYQALVNDLKARSGLTFSRSYLKRVEDGGLAPNALLIYALEKLVGVKRGELLELYARDVMALSPRSEVSVQIGASAEDVTIDGKALLSDLSRHTRTGQSDAPQKGESDAPAKARIRELEGRVTAYKAIVRKLRSLSSEALVLLGDRLESPETPRAKQRRGRSH